MHESGTLAIGSRAQTIVILVPQWALITWLREHGGAAQPFFPLWLCERPRDLFGFRSAQRVAPDRLNVLPAVFGIGVGLDASVTSRPKTALQREQSKQERISADKLTRSGRTGLGKIQ